MRSGRPGSEQNGQKEQDPKDHTDHSLCADVSLQVADETIEIRTEPHKKQCDSGRENNLLCATHGLERKNPAQSVRQPVFSILIKGWSFSTFSPCFTRISIILHFSAAFTSLNSFIASTMHTGVPASTVSPT